MSTNEKKKSKQFKGVRVRNWGRWVSEIRVPKSDTRIWLGSYDTAEKAARAYDAAVYCLHGPEGRFNFAVSDLNFTKEERLALTIDQVKAIATMYALGKPHDRSLWAPLMTISSPAIESSTSAAEPSNASSSTSDVHPSPVDWDANLSLDLLLQDGDLMKETIIWDLF